MLPKNAKTYFDTLWADGSSNGWQALDRKQTEFERREFASGQGPDGGGFAARLSKVYKENLSFCGHVIVDALKEVHSSFGSPLEEGVDDQLVDWGVRALSATYQQLEGAYTRHLLRYGVTPERGPGLDVVYGQVKAFVANAPRRHLWELRNVPAKRPRLAQSGVEIVRHQTINFGDVSASQVQINSNGSTQMHENHGTGDVAALVRLIDALSMALDNSRLSGSVEAELRAELATLKAQVESPRPKWQVIRATAKSIKTIAEGAAGGVLGTVVQPLVLTLIALAAS